MIKFCTKQKYHLYHSGLPWTREANNHTTTKWWCEFSWSSAFLLVIFLPFFINLEITWTLSSPPRKWSHFSHFNCHHLYVADLLCLWMLENKNSFPQDLYFKIFQTDKSAPFCLETTNQDKFFLKHLALKSEFIWQLLIDCFPSKGVFMFTCLILNIYVKCIGAPLTTTSF